MSALEILALIVVAGVVAAGWLAAIVWRKNRLPKPPDSVGPRLTP